MFFVEADFTSCESSRLAINVDLTSRMNSHLYIALTDVACMSVLCEIQSDCRERMKSAIF